MKIDPGAFRVKPGEKVELANWPTRVKDCYKSKEQYKEILGAHVEALSSLQGLLHADNRYALLLIFQAMAAGKDGAIKHVMSGINPQGCQFYSFKQPSSVFLDTKGEHHEKLHRSCSSTVRAGFKCL